MLDLYAFMKALSDAQLRMRHGRFDPEGSGYDYFNAIRAGMGPTGTGENAGHWGSVREAIPSEIARGVPPNSYLMLKGAQHPTWNHGMEAELGRGSEIMRFLGRYFSVPR